MKIEYKPNRDAESKIVDVNLDMAKLSKDTVLSLAEDAAIVKVQARLRMHDAKLADGKEDVLPTDWNEFVTPRERMSKIAKIRSVFENLSDEEKRALLSELTAKGKK